MTTEYQNLVKIEQNIFYLFTRIRFDEANQSFIKWHVHGKKKFLAHSSSLAHLSGKLVSIVRPNVCLLFKLDTKHPCSLG